MRFTYVDSYATQIGSVHISKCVVCMCVQLSKCCVVCVSVLQRGQYDLRKGGLFVLIWDRVRRVSSVVFIVFVLQCVL